MADARDKGKFLEPVGVNDDNVLPEEWLAQLAHNVAEGYVRRGACAFNPDWGIYSYSHTAQYAQEWNEVTRQTRGMIIDDSTGILLARPMQKFFNEAEHPRSDLIFTSPFRITEKMDGSLIVAWSHDEHLRFCTKGSFDTPQAQVAWWIYVEKYNSKDLVHYAHDFTYHFEVIYPQNRIVTDYGDAHDLVLIAIVEKYSGKELDIYGGSAAAYAWKGPKTFSDGTVYKGSTEYTTEHNGRNSALPVIAHPEGHVFLYSAKGEEFFNTGFGFVQRVKVKHANYVELHRLVSNISNVSVWENLSQGKDFDELLGIIPDEFYGFIQHWVDSLTADFKFTNERTRATFDEALRSVTGIDPERSARDRELAIASARNNRKKFAEYVFKGEHDAKEYASRWFTLLDGKNLDAVLWKELRPQYKEPMRTYV